LCLLTETNGLFSLYVVVELLPAMLVRHDVKFPMSHSLTGFLTSFPQSGHFAILKDILPFSQNFKTKIEGKAARATLESYHSSSSSSSHSSSSSSSHSSSSGSSFLSVGGPLLDILVTRGNVSAWNQIRIGVYKQTQFSSYSDSLQRKINHFERKNHI